ncbi:MAG: bestrophin family ion channel [Neisseria sp.]|uniref:bestrophin family protein n=1 Tax=Neisseria sp. TaxID=192066 RepID=UPI0026DDCBFA|nr:bestrophin family ion channel [Neisseria sp.]MDO4641225.1 bestrophin family ion channel [Neisseria sp.]
MIIRDKTTLSLLFAWHGTILPKVLPAIIGLSSVSVLLGIVAHYKWFSIPTPPVLGFTIFGIILSIFLGFRNNACYERWWEGRKLWGTLIATQRRLIRDSQILPMPRRERLLRQTILFTRLLRDRLRHETAYHESLLEYGNLGESGLNTLTSDHINPPQFILGMMQKELIKSLKNQEISDIVYTSLTESIAILGNVQAGCDRIASTPLPFAYSVLLHRAIYSFCFMLPFGIENILGLWTPFMVAWLVYMFLGLDALSSQLEEPFGTQDNDLPLDAIVRLVEREILTALGGTLPEMSAAEHFKVL